jgi:hypothetical protein
MDANRNYKDTIFRRLYKDKKKLIILYNAIMGTDYGEDTDIEITNLDESVFTGTRDDISFIIDGRLVILIEHQSTINENMPYRFLEYIVWIYKLTVPGKSRYQRKLLRLPKPEFFVLYNGKDTFPKEKTLRLSDAFIETGEQTLELLVKVININHGDCGKADVLAKDNTLKDYSFFINLVRERMDLGDTREEAIVYAVNYCIEHNILKEFLEEHREEVLNMWDNEFDLNIALEVSRE